MVIFCFGLPDFYMDISNKVFTNINGAREKSYRFAIPLREKYQQYQSQQYKKSPTGKNNTLQRNIPPKIWRESVVLLYRPCISSQTVHIIQKGFATIGEYKVLPDIPEAQLAGNQRIVHFRQQTFL